MNSPLKIGVIGLGRAGWRIHLEALKKDPRFLVTAVVDPDAARRAEAIEAFGCRGFDSIDGLVGLENLEIVVVATPSAQHAADAAFVLEAGFHCVVEKPMAGSYAEAAALVELAREKKRKLFVHHQLPFRAEFQNLQAVANSGDLGQIFHIQAFWAQYARRWDWQTLTKNGGGLLNNHATHALSLVLPLLDGPAESVTADLRNIKDAGDAEDHVNLQIKTASGQTASVIVSTACALPSTRWMILGSSGTFTSDGTTCQVRFFRPADVPSLEVIDATAPDRAYQSEKLPWQEKTWQIEPGANADGFYTNVHEVLRKGAEVYVTPESALEVARVIGLARQKRDRQFVSSH